MAQCATEVCAKWREELSSDGYLGVYLVASWRWLHPMRFNSDEGVILCSGCLGIGCDIA